MAQKETLSSLTHGNFAKELSISAGKMPPNAVEFEKLVIGTFLIDKKGLDYSIDLLTPEVFYDPRHQVIFSAILKLYEKNEPGVMYRSWITSYRRIVLCMLCIVNGVFAGT